MDDELMRQRVASAPVATLGTVGRHGRPHLVPCTFALEGDTVYTAVDEAKPKSTRALRRLDNIRADPRVTLLVDHYDEDWSRLWWVRLDGEATVSEAGAAAHGAGVRLLRDKYPQYADTPLDGPVIAVAVRAWRGWP